MAPSYQLSLFPESGSGGQSLRVEYVGALVPAVKSAMQRALAAAVPPLSRARVVDRMNAIAERYGVRLTTGRARLLFGKWLFERERARELACVGCDKHCTVESSADFEPQPCHIADMNRRGVYYTLSPREMVSRIPLLRVGQAAYCLNVSERTIYEWVAEGKLVKAKGDPVRIKAEDVALLMNDFDE